MENPTGMQTALFQMIKDKLLPNVSLVHEIGELLGLSYDSAYRRIRLEKDLTIDELYKLSKHYGISVDVLFGVKSNNILFNYLPLEPGKFGLTEWFATISEDIKRIAQCKEKKIIYAAKDPPFFHYFQFPEIAAFKMFFWQKTLLQVPEYEDRLFNLKDVNPEIFNAGKHVMSVSTKIPTIEIWNEDTFNMTLRQIEYYWVSGFISNKDDVLNLCDKLIKWIRHTQKQAELGYKFIFGQDPEGIEGSFQLYQNEVVLNDNSIFVKTDQEITVYLTFNVLSLMITRNPLFCDYVENYMNSLIKKSNLISVSGDKERNRFFNKLLGLVDEFVGRI